MEENKREQYSFAFERFQNGVGLVRANKRVYEKDRQTVYHNHDYAQIWYCYRESYQQNIEGKIYDCPEGSLVVIPPGVRHDVRFTSANAEVLMMDVNYTAILAAAPEQYPNLTANLWLPAFSGELGCELPLCRMLCPKSQQVVEEIFSWFVLSNYAAGKQQSKTEVLQQLESLFTIAECALPEKHRRKAENIFRNWVYPSFQIVDYLNIHYPEKILEEDFLRESGFSHASLNRYFKRISGFSYTQYLVQLRVKRAYIYIRTTTYPLSYISDMCGFYDLYHMSQAFYKYIGERPKQRSIKLREYYGRK